jgi:hypothetical protein
VIKLNGGITAGRRNFLATEDHYIDYLSHQGIKESLPEMLMAKLTKRGTKENSHLLFLGYSLRHWTMRVILRRIWSESLSNQNKRWTVILEKRFNHIDTKFWTKYGVQPSDLKQIDSMDTYITKLTEKLDNLPPLKSPSHDLGKVIPFTAKSNRNGVFISYSHEDRVYFNELKTMLFPVQTELNIWHDQMIEPGTLWRQEIEKALASAKAALLLVSPDFLKSDFIQKHELPPLLEAAKANGCKILWIKLKDCLVDATAIDEYQALYRTPLIGLTEAERNKAIYQIAEDVRKVLETKEGN